MLLVHRIRLIPVICLLFVQKSVCICSLSTVIAYMDEVPKGKKKVSGVVLAPNELVHKVLSGGILKKVSDVISGVPGRLENFISTQINMVNGQWNTLIESIRNASLLATGEKGYDKKKIIDLGECLAIGNVSGSNAPEVSPYNAATGLSLVVTNLCYLY
ncbi:hypothetical protein BDF21DRAFT_404796 [Thamnidium elegans]|nr:hypothetical protein BDF21DRAFT_404796 [Thamnidium elegans]